MAGRQKQCQLPLLEFAAKWPDNHRHTTAQGQSENVATKHRPRKSPLGSKVLTPLEIPRFFGLCWLFVSSWNRILPLRRHLSPCLRFYAVGELIANNAIEGNQMDTYFLYK